MEVKDVDFVKCSLIFSLYGVGVIVGVILFFLWVYESEVDVIGLCFVVGVGYDLCVVIIFW